MPRTKRTVRDHQTLYQYWIHTELVGKLGPLEWVMNTPSHHRVHHARNPYCIDHNYGTHVGAFGGERGVADGLLTKTHRRAVTRMARADGALGTAGVLIIWDRMFGTFQEERDDDPPVYGITHPLDTFDPFYSQFHQFFDIAQRVWTTPGLANKVRACRGRPRLRARAVR